MSAVFGLLMPSLLELKNENSLEVLFFLGLPSVAAVISLFLRTDMQERSSNNEIPMKSYFPIAGFLTD